MAGDWIKMRTDLLTSPKVVRMASALKADRFRIAGGLLSVWSLFDVHSEDGALVGYSLELLDELAAWPGFSAAMVDVEWLIQDGESLILPSFDVHNGASAKRRAQDADRKRLGRKMSACEADENRTREEKRREEKKDKSSCDQQTESQKARIPFTEIFDAYAQCLPELPQLRIIDESRKAMIRSRWNADERFQSVDFWFRFFKHVSESDFLMGRTDRPWTGCCFDWLLKPANFRKIVEGNYTNA